MIVTPRSDAWAEVIKKVARRGGEIRADHRLIQAFTTTVSLDDLQLLAHDPAIERLSLDAPVAAQSEPMTSGQILRATLGLKEGGDLVSGGTSWAGDTIGVAVIDSGIEPSGDLKRSRITAFYDFTRGGRSTRPYDDYGHGTHVAGVIGGSGQLSSDAYEGIAPKVTFIGYKVLDSTGSGYTSDVIAAIEHAIEHRTELGIDIINLSLGHPIHEPAASDPLVRAVERAVAEGIVVVASAGNVGTNPETQEVGYGGVTSPGNAPSAITVGAVDIHGTVDRFDDTVADFSSRGPTWYDLYPKPDLVAPGRRLVASAAVNSELYNDYPQLRVAAHGSGKGKSAKHLRLSGTSMAAAVTSGAVALMLEANRAKHADDSIAPNAVKAILQFTAFDMSYDLLTQGAGALNVAGAVRLAEAIDVRVPINWTWVTEWPQPSDLIGGQVIPWAQRILWGDRLVWGDTVYVNEWAWALRIVWGDRLVWDDRLVWGDRIVWGDRLVWGDTSSLVWSLRLVWGDRIVWGDRLVWGDRIVWGDRLVWGDISWYDLPDWSNLGASTDTVAISLEP